jgi:hypothetical protein
MILRGEFLTLIDVLVVDIRISNDIGCHTRRNSRWHGASDLIQTALDVSTSLTFNAGTYTRRPGSHLTRTMSHLNQPEPSGRPGDLLPDHIPALVWCPARGHHRVPDHPGSTMLNPLTYSGFSVCHNPYHTASLQKPGRVYGLTCWEHFEPPHIFW